MSKGLTPGSVLPDFTLPDENGVMHRLSELQGDDAMILMLGRGEHLGTVRLPESPHNLAWGDDDARTLYITALTSIYRIRLAIPGVRPH